MMEWLVLFLNYAKQFFQQAAVIAEHLDKLVYPVLVTSLALFFVTLRRRAKNPETLSAAAQDKNYRKKVYRVNQQTIFLLLIHFIVDNPYIGIPCEVRSVLNTALETLLLFPLLRFFFMLPDVKKHE